MYDFRLLVAHGWRHLGKEKLDDKDHGVLQELDAGHVYRRSEVSATVMTRFVERQVGQVPLSRGRGSDLSVSVVEQVAIRYSRRALARPLRASCLTGGDTIR